LPDIAKALSALAPKELTQSQISNLYILNIYTLSMAQNPNPESENEQYEQERLKQLVESVREEIDIAIDDREDPNLPLVPVTKVNTGKGYEELPEPIFARLDEYLLVKKHYVLQSLEDVISIFYRGEVADPNDQSDLGKALYQLFREGVIVPTVEEVDEAGPEMVSQEIVDAMSELFSQVYNIVVLGDELRLPQENEKDELQMLTIRFVSSFWYQDPQITERFQRGEEVPPTHSNMYTMYELREVFQGLLDQGAHPHQLRNAFVRFWLMAYRDYFITQKRIADWQEKNRPRDE
jgi:hypothetical protein